MRRDRILPLPVILFPPLAIALAMGLSARAAAAADLFPNHVEFQTGTTSTSVVFARLDSDAHLDLIVGNVNANTISILLGDGMGGFRAKHDVATGAGPRGLATGDWDRDGDQDVAVLCGAEGSVRVYVGNGDGTVTDRTTLTIGASSSPLGITAGDWNDDLKGDLAIANGNASTVSVFLGIGNGLFELRHSPGVDAGPYSLQSGDFDRDGRADLATANRSASTVSVLLGNGDGTFQTHTEHEAGFEPVSVAVGDLNGDGHPDLVTANRGGPFTPDRTVSVLLGNGDGSFGSRTDHVVSSGPEAVSIGDLNGDQRPDVAVVHVGIVGVLSILLGRGDGTFQPRQDYATGSSPRALAIGDLNHDGWPDIANANYADNSVSVLLNAGSTVTGVPEESPLPGSLRLGIHPNPARVSARITAQLPPGERATLEIFDARGRLVSTLYRGTPGMPAFARDWDGRRTDGRAVASGVYHARLTVGSRHVTRPVVLIR